jgi:hypothetical protein
MTGKRRELARRWDDSTLPLGEKAQEACWRPICARLRLGLPPEKVGTLFASVFVSPADGACGCLQDALES